MNHTKLELEVIVIDNLIMSDNSYKCTYELIIKVLDTDERFEYNGFHTSLSYISKNGFKIKSSINKPFGGIEFNTFIIPKLDKIGFEIKKIFQYDDDRYDYLKKFYFALDEWSNYWDGFSYDSISHININDNIWKILCKNKTHMSNTKFKLRQMINNVF